MNKTANHPAARLAPRSSLTISLYAVALLILLLAACRQPEPGAARPQEAEATTESEGTATRTPVPQSAAGTTIIAEGELVALHPQLPLAFNTSGRLQELYIAGGDTVAEGDLIAILDDENLQDTLVDAQLAGRQAQNSLAQAQLSLDDLLDWEPDPALVAQAEASLAAAEAGLENAQSQDSVAYSNITAARVRLEQAQRSLDRAQGDYDTAFDPGRDWEQYIDDPSCRTGEQHPNCTGEPYSDRIKRDRELAPIVLDNAKDELEVAQASYNLAVAGLNDNSAVSAEANIASAQQALSQARTGPSAGDIDAARLQVEQAELALEQAQLNQQKAEKALEDTQLFAPQAGTILTVDAVPGGFVAAGAPIATLLDTADLQFHTSNFSERDLAQLSPGQEAVITLKAYPNTPLSAKVLRIAPLAQGVIGDAATFTVILALDPVDVQLLPGMTGRVEITSE